MAKHTMGCGYKASRRVKALCRGQTGANLQENSSKVRNMEWAHITGPMELDVKQSGLTEDSTDEA